MAVILGGDGAVRLNLGNGEKYVANMESWRIANSRSSIRLTSLADNAERRTAGISDWSGDFSLKLSFSDDETVTLSSWAILNFAINGNGDSLKAYATFIIQSTEIPVDNQVFRKGVPGAIGIQGEIVILDVKLDCSEPESPVIAVLSWQADGALALRRGLVV